MGSRLRKSFFSNSVLKVNVILKVILLLNRNYCKILSDEILYVVF